MILFDYTIIIIILIVKYEHKVEFVIVGGYALAFHGAPRYTGDLIHYYGQKKNFSYNKKESFRRN